MINKHFLKIRTFLVCDLSEFFLRNKISNFKCTAVNVKKIQREIKIYYPLLEIKVLYRDKFKHCIFIIKFLNFPKVQTVTAICGLWIFYRIIKTAVWSNTKNFFLKSIIHEYELYLHSLNNLFLLKLNWNKRKCFFLFQWIHY